MKSRRMTPPVKLAPTAKPVELKILATSAGGDTVPETVSTTGMACTPSTWLCVRTMSASADAVLSGGTGAVAVTDRTAPEKPGGAANGNPPCIHVMAKKPAPYGDVTGCSVALLTTRLPPPVLRSVTSAVPGVTPRAVVLAVKSTGFGATAMAGGDVHAIDSDVVRAAAKTLRVMSHDAGVFSCAYSVVASSTAVGSEVSTRSLSCQRSVRGADIMTAEKRYGCADDAVSSADHAAPSSAPTSPAAHELFPAIVIVTTCPIAAGSVGSAMDGVEDGPGGSDRVADAKDDDDAERDAVQLFGAVTDADAEADADADRDDVALLLEEFRPAADALTDAVTLLDADALALPVLFAEGIGTGGDVGAAEAVTFVAGDAVAFPGGATVALAVAVPFGCTAGDDDAVTFAIADALAVNDGITESDGDGDSDGDDDGSAPHILHVNAMPNAPAGFLSMLMSKMTVPVKLPASGWFCSGSR